MQDGQHRAIVRRVEELVAVPGGGERAGFGFAVTDHAGDDEVGMVEGDTEGVRQAVAEFAPLMQGARGFGGAVAANAARKGELPEESEQAVLALSLVRINLTVSAFQPGLGQHRRRAMSGAGDEDQAQVALDDQSVEMRPDQSLTGIRTPVAQQTVLDLFDLQRFLE